MTLDLLAATGSDSGVVVTLAIFAAVLGGLGLVLIAVRILVRRRENGRQTSGEHPVP
jgi:hypothetical protein